MTIPLTQEKELFNALIDRLDLYFLRKGIYGKAQAEAMGYKGYQTLAQIKAYNCRFSVMRLIALSLNCPDLNFYWLFTGQGSMYQVTSPPLDTIQPRQTQIANLKNRMQLLQEMIAASQRSLYDCELALKQVHKKESPAST